MDAYIPFQLKAVNLWRRDRTKEKGFELLGVINYEKVNIWGKLIEDKGYLDKVYYCSFLLVLPLE